MPNEVVRYGPEVKELAFACYVQSDHNVSRATVMLRERLGDAPCPDRSVVSRWAKEEQWALKATEAIAERFPYLNVEHAARLVAMTDEALDTYSAIMRGELDNVKAAAIMARMNVARHVLDLRGLGTSGTRFGAPEAPQLPANLIADDEAALSPQERQRRRLEAEREK